MENPIMISIVVFICIFQKWFAFIDKIIWSHLNVKRRHEVGHDEQRKGNLINWVAATIYISDFLECIQRSLERC